MVKSKKDHAYEHIKSQIVTGGLRPGQRIILATVAHEIGMSTLPVREALMQLAHEGMVSLKAHVGAVVTIADLPRILEVIESLAVLEGYATARAKHSDDLPQVLAALEAATADMESARLAHAWDRFAAANRRFHEAIYAACHNETVRETIERLWDRLEALLGASSFTFMSLRTQGSIADHRTIIRMLGDGSVTDDEVEAFARLHKLTTARSLESQERARAADAATFVEGMH